VKKKKENNLKCAGADPGRRWKKFRSVGQLPGKDQPVGRGTMSISPEAKGRREGGGGRSGGTCESLKSN